MVLVLRRCLRILSVRTILYLIPSLLRLVLIHVELRNCPVPGTCYAMAIGGIGRSSRYVMQGTELFSNLWSILTKLRQTSFC